MSLPSLKIQVGTGSTCFTLRKNSLSHVYPPSCCLCLGLLDAQPYLSLGVGGGVVRTQLHRLGEQQALRTLPQTPLIPSTCALIGHKKASLPNINARLALSLPAIVGLSGSPQFGPPARDAFVAAQPRHLHRSEPAIPATPFNSEF